MNIETNIEFSNQERGINAVERTWCDSNHSWFLTRKFNQAINVFFFEKQKERTRRKTKTNFVPCITYYSSNDQGEETKFFYYDSPRETTTNPTSIVKKEKRKRKNDEERANPLDAFITISIAFQLPSPPLP